MTQSPPEWDVLVVGAGHAGCESVLAAARMGCRTALFTLDPNKMALMPCNPSVGGPGKGHLVREIDALGGEMARNTDATSVQVRLLNTGKGPAVQALRAQSDKHAYSASMAAVAVNQPNLTVVDAAVDDIVVTNQGGSPRIVGIRTSDGSIHHARTVVLTTGTFLRGRIIVGDESIPGGREGEKPADALSHSLLAVGFELGRLKTGTPPRVRRSSIDFSMTSIQEGSERPVFLSYEGRRAFEHGTVFAPSAAVPIAPLGASCNPAESADAPQDSRFETRTWRKQLNCFLVHTNAATHDIIRENLDRAPMFNGEITAEGPRYCPSIEAKIVRFASKSSHQLFLEPEGWHTDEIYVQGANTSLPLDVQLAMLRTIPALVQAEIARQGYAIEYDYIPAHQVLPTLESKPIAGLFLAGQIIGTTGYEEAGALGLMAGINAARQVQQEEPVVLRRDQAYIGVLIDDLATKELREPYRMHTTQAEYRLLLREDSAEARLSAIGHEIGLLKDDRFRDVSSRLSLIDQALSHLDSVVLTPSVATNDRLTKMGLKPLTVAMTGREILRRVDVSAAILHELGVIDDLPEDVAREVETVAKYEGYISRQAGEVRRLARMESRRIPDWVDYETVRGLRSESREKLTRVRPRTIGQASRIGGVPPTDVSLVLFHIERRSREAATEAASV
jgi:tRNA uridine 5-carboxymethylaminomethyl modification enzyme